MNQEQRFRTIKTPNDIEAVHLSEFSVYNGREDEAVTNGCESLWVGASGAAKAAILYGEVCRFTRVVHQRLKECEHGSKEQRRIFGLWKRCIRARAAWQNKFSEWSKS